MIIFYGEGRLGNQVFQYQALNGICAPGEVIAAAGLEDLPKVFATNGVRLVVLTRRRLVKRLWKHLILPLILRPMAKTLRLINYAFEADQGTPPHRGPSGELTRRRGLIARITLVDGGYYQSASHWERRFPPDSLRILSALRDAAAGQLRALRAPAGKLIFVHVRRGDYFGHAAYGASDLVLPPDFYRRGIAAMRRRFGGIHCLFVTDDVHWVRTEFSDLGEKTVVSSSPEADFAMMASCQAGIVSNSTYSLAAALCIEDPDLLIAPLHWLGFRAGMWLPPNIRIDDARIQYLVVQPTADAP